jgi:hypothetical protein
MNFAVSCCFFLSVRLHPPSPTLSAAETSNEYILLNRPLRRKTSAQVRHHIERYFEQRWTCEPCGLNYKQDSSYYVGTERMYDQEKADPSSYCVPQTPEGPRSHCKGLANPNSQVGCGTISKVETLIGCQTSCSLKVAERASAITLNESYTRSSLSVRRTSSRLQGI